MKNLKVTKIAAAAGAALALGVVSQSAFAHANLLPAIKVGGGWVSVVSYVNTQPAAGGGVFVHATHQSKDMSKLGDACVHVDGRSTTTINDLTTTVLDTPAVWPVRCSPRRTTSVARSSTRVTWVCPPPRASWFSRTTTALAPSVPMAR
ncbi:MAG: hypothetical protein HZY78_07215 [Burkholderiaceae bacterium]|nr:MAG: hypothetical protein HZY78_07215 [Burkholderiaceae bacterium]